MRYRGVDFLVGTVGSLVARSPISRWRATSQPTWSEADVSAQESWARQEHPRHQAALASRGYLGPIRVNRPKLMTLSLLPCARGAGPARPNDVFSYPKVSVPSAPSRDPLSPSSGVADCGQHRIFNEWHIICNLYLYEWLAHEEVYGWLV